MAGVTPKTVTQVEMGPTPAAYKVFIVVEALGFHLHLSLPAGQVPQVGQELSYGLGESNEARADTAVNWTEMDLLADFLAEVCVTGPQYKGWVKEIYGAYTQWCEAKGEALPSQTVFGRWLTKRGFIRKTSNRGLTMWQGLALATSAGSKP